MVEITTHYMKEFLNILLDPHCYILSQTVTITQKNDRDSPSSGTEKAGSHIPAQGLLHADRL
jgi:hypothetical protein